MAFLPQMQAMLPQMQAKCHIGLVNCAIYSNSKNIKHIGIFFAADDGISILSIH